ncbi:MAG: DUF4129 domain-containing protein, partial [Candidatus Promineifilaceae bacterium]
YGFVMSSHASVIPNDESADSRAWQLWGLFRQELLYICWALMEVALLAPFAIFVLRWAQFWNAGQLTLWLFFLMLLPFNLVRLLSTLEQPPAVQKRVVFIALLLALFISWRALLYGPRPLSDMSWLGEFYSHLGDLGNPLWGRDLSLFLLGILAWWRGLRLAQLAPDIYRAGFRLRIGVLLLALLGLLLYETGNLWGATPFVLLFFLAGLTTLALIRAEQIEREHSGFSSGMTPGWVAIIVLTSLLTVMTAGLFAAILSGEAAIVLSGWLAPLWKALWALLAVALSTIIFLLSPLFLLLNVIVTLLANLFEGIFAAANITLQNEQVQNVNVLESFNELLSQNEADSLTLPPEMLRLLTIVIMLLVALAIVYFLTRAFRQPQTAASPSTIIGEQAIYDRGPKGLGERILRRLGIMRRWRAAASIRRIYVGMCEAAADAGYGRDHAQTPYEYLQTLGEMWPENTADCRLITDAYVRVRYGEVPESSEELSAIRAAWQRLLARLA